MITRLSVNFPVVRRIVSIHLGIHHQCNGGSDSCLITLLPAAKDTKGARTPGIMRLIMTMCHRATDCTVSGHSLHACLYQKHALLIDP